MTFCMTFLEHMPSELSVLFADVLCSLLNQTAGTANLGMISSGTWGSSVCTGPDTGGRTAEEFRTKSAACESEQAKEVSCKIAQENDRLAGRVKKIGIGQNREQGRFTSFTVSRLAAACEHGRFPMGDGTGEVR